MTYIYIRMDFNFYLALPAIAADYKPLNKNFANLGGKPLHPL